MFQVCERPERTPARILFDVLSGPLAKALEVARCAGCGIGLCLPRTSASFFPAHGDVAWFPQEYPCKFTTRSATRLWWQFSFPVVTHRQSLEARRLRGRPRRGRSAASFLRSHPIPKQFVIGRRGNEFLDSRWSSVRMNGVGATRPSPVQVPAPPAMGFFVGSFAAGGDRTTPRRRGDAQAPPICLDLIASGDRQRRPGGEA